MKSIFTCVAVLLAALVLGSGCSTTSHSGAASSPGNGQDANAPATHDIYTPAVAAPQ